MSGWELYELSNERECHIVPECDLKIHNHNRNCWCNPVSEYESNIELLIHKSADGREEFETGQRKMS